MKKLALSMMSLAMILFITSTVHSASTNDPFPSNSPGITFIVSVKVSNVNSLCHPYYVVITDKGGNLCTAPQPYQVGIENYVFHEAGPVTGTRVANLIEIEGLDHHVCLQKVYTYPDILKDRFRNHSTYKFTLIPRFIASDE